MDSSARLHATEAFQSAFKVAPEVATQLPSGDGIGIYGWTTPEMQGFALPETDDLIVALHLGGSRRVHAITDRGLSRNYSAPGLVTILPAGRPVAFRTDGSIRVMTLHVPARSGEMHRISQLAAASTERFAFRDAYVRSAMEVMLSAARVEGDQSVDYLRAVADALIFHLTRAIQSHGHHTPQPCAPMVPRDEGIVGKVTSHIEAHLSEKLSLDKLASTAGTSRATLIRDFRLATGHSVHQYITLRRIEAARRLLRTTDLDLSTIAYEAGFCSQSHFIGLFRQIVGCTPRQYRSDGASRAA